MAEDSTIRFYDKTIILPIQYFGSTNYYALLSAFETVVIDDRLPFDKRFKSAHRMEIADTHGRIALTVPVCKPHNLEKKARWSDVGISSHGAWWHTLSQTIASAYGRSPFYEFYIDRLSCFFYETTISTFGNVARLDMALNRVICDILGLDNTIIVASSINDSRKSASIHSTESIIEDNSSRNLYKSLLAEIKTEEYYQVCAPKHGFINALSILDLIFNMGPEAPLILRKMTSNLKL